MFAYQNMAYVDLKSNRKSATACVPVIVVFVLVVAAILTTPNTTPCSKSIEQKNETDIVLTFQLQLIFRFSSILLAL